MKQIFVILLATSLLLAACASTETNPPCNDPLGCVTIGNGESIKIAVELTLSGSNAPYGVDALRGVELAIADQGAILNHPIELVQEDDLCTAEGGQVAAERITQDQQILGVIGATCSSATEKAAKVLSEAGMVLISPSSTASTLTSSASHQEGFLRTIYNDQSQAQLVAEFVFEALGARTMATIHDGTAYSQGLQEDACRFFAQRGGECVAQLKMDSGGDPSALLAQISKKSPDALYIPLYTADAMSVTANLIAADLKNVAVIGSDGLLNSDFANKARNADGIYISGPTTIDIGSAFAEKYRQRYGEEPIAVYAAQAYDAAMMLFRAIQSSSKTTGRDIVVSRTTLRAALYATSDYQGLSGVLTCSPLGDCAPPNIVIYQLNTRNFRVIYP